MLNLLLSSGVVLEKKRYLFPFFFWGEKYYNQKTKIFKFDLFSLITFDWLLT
jgi:hypothetical protein